MKLQDLLRHIADNVENGRDKGAYLFYKGGKFQGGLPDLSQHEHFSLAPRTHVVNGFTVPAPESTERNMGSLYYIPDASEKNWFMEFEWENDEADDRNLKRGLIYVTPRHAIANAKAMRSIDPYSEGEK